MIKTETLITPRLILRPVRLSDALAIQRIFPTWHMTRYMSAVPWPYPKDGAVSFLQKIMLPNMRRGKHWMWAITLKGGDDVLIGLIHLRPGKTNRGFWMAPNYHGKGYMSEAVVAVNEFAFTRAGFKRLVISNAKPNRASSRIKEKTGGRFIGYRREHFIAGTLPAEMWELTKEMWESR
ncbi:MAG TPA: GNAT family N-acetyltransferase [Alphaproteobacteria bacterium]|nr:GNAT family N-acetyltransferase [Alphaproteobacteria bacterium]